MHQKLTRKGFLRFIRYAAIGVSTFLLDLGMLYLAVTYAHIPYYLATPCSFLIAISINYALSRRIVFRGTSRSWHGGYLYFAGVAICGALITTVLVAGLVEFLGLYFIVARVIVAAIVGMGNYLFNLYINFKMVGKHSPSD